MKPDEGPLLQIEYLRIRPDGGLEFGRRNGMRPRGLLVHEEGEPGGKLEGVVSFRGMRFTPPRGHTPPVHHFELVHVDERR